MTTTSRTRGSTTKTREDLRSLPLSWASMTNAFIAPTGSNTRLEVYKPAGIDERDLEEMTPPPQGVRLQVQGGAGIERLDDGPAGIALPEWRAGVRAFAAHFGRRD
jgi:hypothetical protein